jgi:hypothetical protein
MSGHHSRRGRQRLRTPAAPDPATRPHHAPAGHRPRRDAPPQLTTNSAHPDREPGPGRQPESPGRRGPRHRRRRRRADPPGRGRAGLGRRARYHLLLRPAGQVLGAGRPERRAMGDLHRTGRQPNLLGSRRQPKPGHGPRPRSAPARPTLRSPRSAAAAPANWGRKPVPAARRAASGPARLPECHHAIRTRCHRHRRGPGLGLARKARGEPRRGCRYPWDSSAVASYRTPWSTRCHHLRVSSSCHRNCRGCFPFQP